VSIPIPASCEQEGRKTWQRESRAKSGKKKEKNLPSAVAHPRRSTTFDWRRSPTRSGISSLVERRAMRFKGSRKGTPFAAQMAGRAGTAAGVRRQ
jgi:ribosomal protein S11